MHISTVNITKMVTVGAYITIGITYDVKCGLSISIFIFDFGRRGQDYVHFDFEYL